MFLLTATQLSFSLISVFLLIRFELRTQLSFSLISVFLLIRFELRTQLSFSLISVFLLIRFELRTQEATQLKMELDKAQETIQAAETLVSKLDGEFKRWSGQVGCTITINSRV